ncbi:CobW family GTP-binding protein [Anaerobacillus sp. MEB173]|uniref:CobW family GTP-binding protein n=1 Tax=Anaerobacillus sp. MEB173 TaxID=3383345 RepID=UPI003F8D93E7
MGKKIPVYVISGFLGSGKTTVLLHIIEECKRRKLTPGIILNELGEVNVEKDLFQDQQMLELLNGCICCSIQSDLTREIRLFLEQAQKTDSVPDLLLIEGTGIANPIEVVMGLTDPSLIDLLELQSIITIVDGSKYLEYQSIFTSSKEIREVLKDQLTNSTLVLLNKLDIISGKQIEKVRKKIRATVKDYVEVIETQFGKAEIDELLKQRMKSITLHNHEGECNENCNYESHDSVSHHHNHAFQTIKVDELPVFDHVQLQKWYEGLPENIVRGKGLIRLLDSPGLFQFQYSSKQFRIQRVNQAEPQKPCMIIIGYQLNSKQIKDSFEKTFLQ